MVCTSIATAHRIMHFRVVELFEAEKRTVTLLQNQHNCRPPRASGMLYVGHANPQGSSHNHKTNNIEPRTAVLFMIAW